MSGAVSVLTTGQLDDLCAQFGLDPPEVLVAGHDGPGARPPGRHTPAADDVWRLARAPLAVDVQLPGAVAAVAAVHTGYGILAVRRGRTVTLRRLAPQDAIGAVAELLGPLRPAALPPARVPVPVLTAALTAAGDDPARLRAELMRRGMSGTGARTLVAANRDVDAVTRIGATVRTPDGPHRSPYLLTVQRTPAGHHCQRPHRAPGHPDVLEITPATRDHLTHELDELVRATAGEPPAGRGQRRAAGRGSTRPADTGGIGSGTGTSTR